MADGVQQNRDRGRPDYWHPDEQEPPCMSGKVRINSL